MAQPPSSTASSFSQQSSAPLPGRAFSLYAKAEEGHAQRVAQTVSRLRAAAAAHPGQVVLATSLGAEDQVLTDLIAKHRLPVAVATLQTGALHEQTVRLISRTEQHYASAGLRIECWAPPAQQVLQFVARHGAKAIYESVAVRKACCNLRKLEPLARLLNGRSAWVTGLRRQQSDARAEVPYESVDEQGRHKYAPLADWSQADVWHYIQTHGVPYNPLHDAFFPSIGCEPCTRAIAVGEDIRAGRWWWEQAEQGPAKECGLHVQGAQP